MANSKIWRFFENNLPYARITRYVKYISTYYGTGKMRKRFVGAIKGNLGEDVSNDVIRYHLKKMRRAFLRDAWDQNEYFYFHYDQLSREGIKRYVVDVQKDMFCARTNPAEVHLLFKKKMDTYRLFKQYYKRDVCMVESPNQDLTELRQFIDKHKDFIIKPNDSSMGNGVQILHDATVDTVLGIMGDYPNGAILEELITQADKMSSVYPKSINTVRLTTWIVNGKTHLIRSFIRFGQGGSVVDNAAQGGLIGAVDQETGVITYVCNESGEPYLFHPDTHTLMVGFQIPHWAEAKKLALELSTINPKAIYVGWDLACTDNGWVMVEGNSRGQLVCQQLSFRSGIAQELKAIDPNCFRPQPFLKNDYSVV